MRAGRWTQWRSRLRVRTRLRRWWRRRDPARARLPRVFANSLPKAGTHLLLRAVALMPGMVWEEIGLRRGWLVSELGQAQAGDAEVVPVGVAEVRWVRADKLAEVIGRLEPGEVTGGHMPYSEGFVKMLERKGIRALFIVRDPRDVAVSLMYHILGQPETRLAKHFARAFPNDGERLRACILGTEGVPGRTFLGLGRRLELFLPWLRVPWAHTVRFERLVGPRGGGSEEAQQAEIAGIARHLGLPLTLEQVRSVGSQLFGQGSTFRRGQIGSWREHFNEENKAALKQVAGQRLIELGYEGDLEW